MKRIFSLLTAVLVLGSLNVSPALRPVSVDIDCTRTSMGLVPLSDLGTATYMGSQGGLYPGGGNIRPAAHESGGIEQALAVRPLDANGQPDAAGKYVLLSIGMSNTTQEFSVFKPIADADSQKNPKLVIVDGAQGGRDAIDWSNPNNSVWNNVLTRLTQAGVTQSQVQVVWLKQQLRGDGLADFPTGANTLRDRLRDITLIAKSRYPNLRVLYLSSRSYAGYSGQNRGLGAYESGFGVKWLVEEQVNCDPRLAYTGTSAPAPWIAWGPYLWADGLTPRGDGLTYACSDYSDDGIHPTLAGREKIANILLNFFKTDSTARLWFLDSPSAILSGRVSTPDGRGLSNTVVTLVDPTGIPRSTTTSSFGFYTFDSVPTGQTYMLRVSSRRYKFTARSLAVNGNLSDVDFIGSE